MARSLLSDLRCCYAFIDQECMGQGVFLVKFARLRGDQGELLALPVWKVRVALDCQFDFSQIQALRDREKEGVDLFAADDEDFAIFVFVEREYFIHGMDNFDALVGEGLAAGQHDISAPGQRLAHRIKGFASHDDRVAGGDALEIA